MDPDRVFKVLIRICEKNRIRPDQKHYLITSHLFKQIFVFCFLGNVVEDTDDTAGGLG